MADDPAGQYTESPLDRIVKVHWAEEKEPEEPPPEGTYPCGTLGPYSYVVGPGSEWGWAYPPVGAFRAFGKVVGVSISLQGTFVIINSNYDSVTLHLGVGNHDPFGESADSIDAQTESNNQGPVEPTDGTGGRVEVPVSLTHMVPLDDAGGALYHACVGGYVLATFEPTGDPWHDLFMHGQFDWHGTATATFICSG